MRQGPVLSAEFKPAEGEVPGSCNSVGAAGLEPATLCLEGSIHLSISYINT